MKNIKKFTNRSRKNSEYYLSSRESIKSEVCEVCNCDPCDCHWGYNEFDKIVISNGGTFEDIKKTDKKINSRSSN
jgi:hypothetical protein